MYDGFTAQKLDDACSLFSGRLPEGLLRVGVEFDELWNLHPSEYHKLPSYGRLVPTPRWQQAFGRDYHFTGRTNKALPIPPTLAPFLCWSKEAIDDRLNGLLLNWYDGRLGHYIGKHRDSVRNMVHGAPIVTISLGEQRVFRLRPWKQKGFVDLPAANGTVFVMPYDTNLAWTHEVPHSAQCRGRRISITLRAFK